MAVQKATLSGATLGNVTVSAPLRSSLHKDFEYLYRRATPPTVIDRAKRMIYRGGAARANASGTSAGFAHVLLAPSDGFMWDLAW